MANSLSWLRITSHLVYSPPQKSLDFSPSSRIEAVWAGRIYRARSCYPLLFVRILRTCKDELGEYIIVPPVTNIWSTCGGLHQGQMPFRVHPHRYE
jgi:hypothetical protein